MNLLWATLHDWMVAEWYELATVTLHSGGKVARRVVVRAAGFVLAYLVLGGSIFAAVVDSLDS